MKVSYNWLKDYVNVTLPPEELAKALTARGVVVETLTYANPGVQGVVVGKVVEIGRHPNADTLWVCQVDVGGKVLQILTGAQNVRQGDLVPAAIPGSKLPGMTMAVKSLRGIESNGMLCSAVELGVGDDSDGILILPDDKELTPGLDAADILGLNDWILELDLTANYAAHAQSMVGVAQETAAIVGGLVDHPETYTEDQPNTDATRMIAVRIEAPDLCDRYVARIVQGVKIGQSPAWMQARLRAAGMRPINNIVDIANFVMLEMGQPLHTFDFAKIASRQIVVRRARDGEEMTTLDGQTRTLDADILVIADGNGPVAMAGVMGGLQSEVTAQTVDILIESAHFHNINNRRTALRMNLPSEAARRFTKGVDPNGCVRAADRAAQLIALLAGGTVVRGHVDAYPRPTAPTVLLLRTPRANAHIGLVLTADRMAEHLTNLGMAVLSPADLANDLTVGRPEPEEEEGDDLGGRPVWTAMHQVSPVPVDPESYAAWADVAWGNLEAAGARLEQVGAGEALIVVVPTRRLDISIEVDLVEEIARSEGYDTIPAVLPVLATTQGGRTALAAQVLNARRILAAMGLDEVMTHSLTHPRVYDRLQLPVDSDYRTYLTLGNPLYEERSVLRTTLLPGMLDILQHNVNRQGKELAVFETAHVYRPQAGEALPVEPRMLGIALMGSLRRGAWNQQPEAVDFYTLKGIVAELLIAMNVTEWSLQRSSHPSFHPGRQAELRVGARSAGVFGELHPSVQEAWDLPSRVYAAELAFEVLAGAAKSLREYRPVPRFPSISRDLALVIPQTLPAAQVAEAIRNSGGALLADVELFDLYEGDRIASGQRSLAYRLVYRAGDRTLTDADIEPVHAAVRGAVEALGATLRS